MNRPIHTIVYGPQGCGKTTNSELMKHAFACENVYDGVFTSEIAIAQHIADAYGRTPYRTTSGLTGKGNLYLTGFDLSRVQSNGSVQVLSFTDAMAEASKWYLCAGGEPPHMSVEERAIYEGVNALCRLSHKRALDAGWYHNLSDGEPKVMNFGERCMLMVSEITEAFEAERKSTTDDKLTDRCGQEAEFADTLVRIADTSGHREYDLGGAIIAKMRFNLIRPDHKKENRAAAGGKAF